jgi:diguanylate cyclase (GGDEF)-like protein
MDKKTIIELEQVSKNDSLDLEDIKQCATDKLFYRKLQEKLPNKLHTLLILHLTHEKLPEDEAKSLWQKMLKHLKSMNTSLNRDVGLTVAAMDYITNISKIREQPVLINEKKSKNIINSATEDSLTGLYAREFFDAAIVHEFNQCEKCKHSISLIMIDIDDFKKVNDSCGHQFGDYVLEQIGKIIRKNVRDKDIATRYGGEELVIILPQSSADNSKKIAERIRRHVEQSVFKKNLKVTVSIGICEMRIPFSSIEDLVKCADNALYKSKAKGKNRTTILNAN